MILITNINIQYPYNNVKGKIKKCTCGKTNGGLASYFATSLDKSPTKLEMYPGIDLFLRSHTGEFYKQQELQLLYVNRHNYFLILVR